MVTTAFLAPAEEEADDARVIASRDLASLQSYLILCRSVDDVDVESYNEAVAMFNLAEETFRRAAFRETSDAANAIRAAAMAACEPERLASSDVQDGTNPFEAQIDSDSGLWLPAPTIPPLSRTGLNAFEEPAEEFAPGSTATTTTTAIDRNTRSDDPIVGPGEVEEPSDESPPTSLVVPEPGDSILDPGDVAPAPSPTVP